MDRPIGGYFEIEKTGKGGNFPQYEGVLLNTGRNALEYVLASAGNVSCVYLPYYTCEVLLEPIKKLGVKYRFYSIDCNLEIADEFPILDNECIVYTNYFGVKDAYVQVLAEKIGEKLVVDNAQALFAKAISGIKTIYSLRKYVGIPDGGVACCNDGHDITSFPVDDSSDKMSHLFLRKEKGPQAGYADFRDNSRKLVMQPIKRMSLQTKSMVDNIDFDEVKQIRRKNFKILHDALSGLNKLDLPSMDSFECPMVYPFWTTDLTLRQRLIDNQIFVAMYWPNVLEWSNPCELEYELAFHILPLPIDQRYGEEEMNGIIELIYASQK